ncbi:splicing factor 3B subunit 1-like [Dorcoceras hygrometricum]|uniref:Splicing factor 3B subunit 1-like n=1 Tax=Dorcoceras hygrometricum TaxID=472368 RepID=A0A2Z7ANA1_9LAMI|nr:splicing factor 3B subunit 1-like [Dorcoceras hygrometricum]
MKVEFHLLKDILAKIVTVKAGSFDAVTHERFLMMSAIHGGVKGAPDLELEESKEFPPLKILTAKTFGTYEAKNKNITVDVDEPAGDEPVVKKKAASKRIPAPTIGEPVAKKNKTIVGKAAPSDKDLALVTVAQDIEPISTVPAVTPPVPKRKDPKRKLKLPKGYDDEKEPHVEDVVEKERETTVVDEVDQIIVQIEIEQSIAVNDEDDNLDGAKNEIARKMASFTAPKRFFKEPLRSGEDDDMSGFKQPSKIIETEEETEKNKEMDIEPVVDEPVATEELSLVKSVATMTYSEDTEALTKVLELTAKSMSDEESMSIDDLLAMIPADMMLPSVTTEEPTKSNSDGVLRSQKSRKETGTRIFFLRLLLPIKGRRPLSKRME